MWFSKPEIVTIIIDGNSYICCIIKETNSDNPILVGFELITYVNHEIHQGRIFNHAALHEALREILKQYGIKNPVLALGFKPSNQQEKILFTPSKKVSKDDFSFDTSTPHSVQHHIQHIGTTKDNLELHYGCSIEHSSLMQYRLFSHIAQVPLIHLTTSTAALLYALAQNNLPVQKNSDETLSNYIKECLNLYTLGDHLSISDILNWQVAEHKELLLACLGLFLLGRNRNGKT
jgi:hypothetical protein